MKQCKSDSEIRADRKDIATLKAAHADPKDLAKRVALNRLRWERMKAGKLPAWEWVGK